MPTVLAPAIRTSQFSFVRFSDQHLDDADWIEAQIPGASLGFNLPVANADDLIYQFIIESDDTGDIDQVCGASLSAFQFKIARGSNAGPTLNLTQFAALPSAGTFSGAQLSIERYRLNSNQVLIFVPKISTIPLFNGLSVDQCFQIAVHEPGMDLCAISNVFYYTDQLAYTSLIDYYSEFDEADFYYCISPTLKNRVRLPLYLTRPTYPEDESIYRQSTGRTIIQKSVVREVFEVIVDEMPNWAIQSLRAILLHEERYIESLPYTGYFDKEGGYDVEWPDFLNYPFGIPYFKVATDTNLMKNNNCGDCADPGYAMVLAGTNVSSMVSNHTYTINLVSLLTATCCNPTSFHILTTNSTKVASASITNGVLTFQSGTIPPSVGFTLFTITASCGSVVSAPATITGTS